MEELGNALFLDAVPEKWAVKAYQSLYGLSMWFADLIQRIKELENWSSLYLFLTVINVTTGGGL